MDITFSTRQGKFLFVSSSYRRVGSCDHQGLGEGEVGYYDYDEYHTGNLDMYLGAGEIADEDGNTFEVEMD